MDFLAGGGTLGLCVAIDFTQSNGDPRSPQSLHFKSPNGENEYTRAIRSVGSILQCYDTDKKFPVYGFGGKVGGVVSHAFPLNGNPANVSISFPRIFAFFKGFYAKTALYILCTKSLRSMGLMAFWLPTGTHLPLLSCMVLPTLHL